MLPSVFGKQKNTLSGNAITTKQACVGSVGRAGKMRRYRPTLWSTHRPAAAAQPDSACTHFKAIAPRHRDAQSNTITHSRPSVRFQGAEGRQAHQRRSNGIASPSTAGGSAGFSKRTDGGRQTGASRPSQP